MLIHYHGVWVGRVPRDQWCLVTAYSPRRMATMVNHYHVVWVVWGLVVFGTA